MNDTIKRLVTIMVAFTVIGSFGMGTVSAATINVGDTNNNADYGTIQEAVDNATDGDTIVLNSTETYEENVTVTTNNLTVESSDGTQVNVTGEVDYSNVSNFTIGDNVAFDSEVTGDSNAGSGLFAEDGLLGGSTFGLSNSIWAIGALVVLVVYYTNDEEF